MLVAVHLDGRVELLAQGVAVGGETDDGEDDAGVVGVQGGVVVGGVGGGSDFEELGGVAGVYAVAGGGARIAGEDGEVGAGDAEGGAAVVSIADVGMRC